MDRDALLHEAREDFLLARSVMKREHRVTRRGPAFERALERRRQFKKRRTREPELDTRRPAAHQLTHRGETLEAATQHDADAIAQRLDIRQDVARQQHRRTARALLEHQVAHIPATERIESAHRFIEDQEFGLVHHGGGKAESLEHALRVLAKRHPRTLAEPDPAQPVTCRTRRFTRAEAREPCGQLKVLDAIQVVVEVGLLGQEAELAAALDVLE